MKREPRETTERLLHRRALDYYFSHPRYLFDSQADSEAQTIPVNVYETEEDVVLVAPMPGVEADNIDIQILGSTVSLRASLRGPGQSDRDYLLHEWTYGPYERTITLPVEVDSARANASHDNGILAISIPKSARSRSIRVPLKGSSKSAKQLGHSGHHTSRNGLPKAE